MSPRWSSLLRRIPGWLAPLVLLAAVPKCLLCVLAYAGLGAALGIGGAVELCGGPVTHPLGWSAVSAITGAGLAAFYLWHRRTKPPGETIAPCEKSR